MTPEIQQGGSADTGRLKVPVPPDESIKETIESIVIAFILAFVFRAYVVEAFVIPTGSMAPTLLGAHAKANCGQCGYTFDVDPNPPDLSKDGAGVIAYCPMCHYQNKIRAGTIISAGDRILVQKYIYNMPGFEPRRGDVVVFKAPHKPIDNYIKRLVGLPNEALQVIEGNVYIAPLDDAGNIQADKWRIWRKTDENENPRALRIQNAVWQPIYHSAFIPLDNGRGRIGQRDWDVPWVVKSGQWTGLGEDGAAHRKYAFAGQGDGRIVFDFDRALSPQALSEERPGLFPYNHVKYGSSELESRNPDVMTDEFRIAVDIISGDEAVSIQLRTEGRINETGDLLPLVGQLDANGEISLYRDSTAGSEREVYATAKVEPLRAGAVRHIELWFVDQELSLWVDGERVCAPQQFDTQVNAIVSRKLLKRLPEIAIHLTGGEATLAHVDVDRDLYYTNAKRYESDTLLYHGVIRKNRATGNVYGEPYVIHPDQFFCMGDNSPASHDSRSWPTTDSEMKYRDVPFDSWSWIQPRKFSDPSLAKPGVVPRRLMMGRAFFVYFPAPYYRAPGGGGYFPNFGDMRFIY